MTAIVYASLLLTSLVNLSFTEDKPWDYKGSTPGLRDIVIGRCEEFQRINVHNRDPEIYVNVNCTLFWEKFSKAFAFNKDCNYTGKYNDALDYIDSSDSITDKVILLFAC